MKNLNRILIAMAIFMSGAALVPFAGLPAEGFRWQTYADAYVPITIQMNHASGAPGSFFSVRGFSFPASQPVTVSVNGVELGMIQADLSGDFLFLIDAAGAEAGFYSLTSDAPNSPTVVFQIDPAAPLRLQEDTGTIFNLPADIANQIVRLPLILN